ncbi:MAG: hydroxymethylglutaryl-CoA lyase [Proteobacteria bacterium]|nr:hydroxymethylglutaryl-CoA lyase [Pseudomonadota bacterium]
MTDRISLTEVGPRDGLQSESCELPTAFKVELINRLIDAGLRRLEVASFVNPKKVPQMADAEAVIGELPRRKDVSYIGLVLNDRGFERAAATGIDEIGMVVVASETFSQRNQGASVDESILAWRSIAAKAKKKNIRAGIMVSVAFGCPFEGEISEKHVLDIAQRVLEEDPDEIAIADSIGAGVPAQVASLVSKLKQMAGDIPVRCHFHNTRNTGLANAYVAIQSGADVIDASVGGMGGCPFAPHATGNIPTEDLVYMLHRSGFATGIDLEKLVETSEWLESKLGHSLPALIPKAGIFPPPKESVLD